MLVRLSHSLILSQTFAGIFFRKVVRHVLDGRAEVRLGAPDTGHLLSVEVRRGITESHLNIQVLFTTALMYFAESLSCR